MKPNDQNHIRKKKLKKEAVSKLEEELRHEYAIDQLETYARNFEMYEREGIGSPQEYGDSN